MLGWLLLGGLFCAAVVIVVSGMIDKSKIRDKLLDEGVEDAIIKEIDRCDNVVKLKDLDSGQTYEIQGDDVADSLYVNQKITV